MRVKRVPVATLRSTFNKSQYPRMIKEGLLIPIFLKDSIMQNPHLKQEPEGTRSQVIRYTDITGEWFVEVHQYYRPDGTLGAGKKPDPKRLKINGLIMIPED